MSEVATINQSNNLVMFSPDKLQSLVEFSKLMAEGTVTVPDHLRGKSSDCLAIVMQAIQWDMNPFVVAQKTYTVNGVLGYEAQLINSLVSTSTAIHGRFHYEYSEGGWEKLTKSKELTKNRNGKDYSFRVRDWTDADEHGLWIRVGAILRGDSEITWGERIYLSSVVTRNSPLWSTNPKQQLAYLAVKYWARLYCPEVILGVYTHDELPDAPIKDVTPPKERVSLNEITQQNEPEQHHEATSGDSNVITGEIVDDGFNPELLRQSITDASTLDEVKEIRLQIDELKSSLGTALFTELKNKAVQAYHRIDANNNLEAQINSLPAGGSPEAKASFEKVFQFLNANKRKLGDELFDSFSLTLNDMKDEYQ
ncbi:RecT family recombinase [Providencia rettgeri]|uniref:RecT family recombinase n=1 Tax=Providencia rettgeri TaxID=587 RepID=UPI001BABB08F|nr:RecT family recombinase [Providencia rettgeri]MBS0857928.1 recombinase RecT [Providencia rettgeri]MBS0871667.1 recombinase RecT [Providencia rettgeri]MBS0918814.1 recombinase RecT [Providencia rettgeri]